MANDQWGKGWGCIPPKTEAQISNVIIQTIDGSIFNFKGDLTDQIKSLEKVYNNLTPTHDPYTNPNSHIYYQCACGAILDPGTKSFAALNNEASRVGWKIRWNENGQGYKPYCVECGKGVE